MRTPVILAVLTAVSFAPIQAQQVFGGPGERKDSTVFVFDEQFTPLAGASVTYGSPMWSDTIAKAVSNPMAGKFRLGKDWWTTFATVTDIKINDTKVAAGSYVLGLECDDKGGFHVLFIDATKAMKHKWMPWSTADWKAEVTVPMTFAKDSLKEAQKELAIELSADKQKPSNGAFAIRWGTHALTAKVHFGSGAMKAPSDASADKKGEHKADKKGEHKGEHK